MAAPPDRPPALRHPGEVAVSELDQEPEFLALEEEWNRLLAESPSDIPFLRHEWLRVWWRHFGRGKRLAVLIARRGGRLTAALPLMETRASLAGATFVTLRSLTNFHSFRYNLIRSRGEEGAVEAIWSYLRRRPRRWHLLRLEEVPDDVPAVTPLTGAARRDGHPVGVWPGYECPFLRLAGTWEDYHASLGRNLRSNLRKKSRHLGEEGRVTFEQYSKPEEVMEALEIGLTLEGSGWKDRAGSAITSDPERAAFYREWAAVAAERGWLRLSLLRVAGSPAAFDYSVVYGGRCYALKIGYDPRWERHSVGQLLKAEILRTCFRNGIGEYDFLGTLSRAKRDWRPISRRHRWHFVYSRDWRSRAHHFAKFTVKRWAAGRAR